MIEEKVSRGKEMEEADCNNNENQKGEKGFSHNLLLTPQMNQEKA